MGQWDFRDSEDVKLSSLYESRGYVIVDADYKYLAQVKERVSSAVKKYIIDRKLTWTNLEKLHECAPPEMSNELRLRVLNDMASTTAVNKSFYYCCKKIVTQLCGSELAMQKRIGLSINYPDSKEDILPIHADTWNGVSPYELNIWIPLVDCKSSMSLYILRREDYEVLLKNEPRLLARSSDEMYEAIRGDLEWIEIKYGKVLAFDQSLPHGYSINKEGRTHISLNCRFKNLHSPYRDKKIGEYFAPITATSSTRLGCRYKEPTNWING